MQRIIEVKLSEHITISDSESILKMSFWSPERISFVYSHNGCLGTFAAGDYFVALQSLKGDLLIGHTKAAGTWDT